MTLPEAAPARVRTLRATLSSQILVPRIRIRHGLWCCAAKEELMGSRIGCWILAIAFVLVVAVAAGTAPPEDVTYQGRLLDPVVRLDAL